MCGVQQAKANRARSAARWQRARAASAATERSARNMERSVPPASNKSPGARCKVPWTRCSGRGALDEVPAVHFLLSKICEPAFLGLLFLAYCS